MKNGDQKVGRKKFGSTNESVSAIGLGTWGIKSYENAARAFEYAFERGINFIDTAEIYNTEDFVGRVISELGRDNLFITTKIWPKNLVTRERTLKAARSSLKKLGIEAVDLILIHWPNNEMKIEDQVRNIEAVYSEGLSRYIGVSNFSVEQMETARQSTRSTEIVCDQVKYNVSTKEAEKNILPYCKKNDMAVVAYTPIENGNVSGNKILKKVGEKYGKTPVQVSLKYLMREENVIPIPKTESLEHVKEIIGAWGWSMEEEDYNNIRTSDI